MVVVLPPLDFIKFIFIRAKDKKKKKTFSPYMPAWKLSYNIWKHIWFWRKIYIVLWYIFFNFLFQKKNTFPESIRKEEDCSACSVRRLLLCIHSIHVALSRYYAQGTELSAEDSGEWRKSSSFTYFTCFMSSKKR